MQAPTQLLPRLHPIAASCTNTATTAASSAGATVATTVNNAGATTVLAAMPSRRCYHCGPRLRTSAHDYQ